MLLEAPLHVTSGGGATCFKGFDDFKNNAVTFAVLTVNRLKLAKTAVNRGFALTVTMKGDVYE